MATQPVEIHLQLAALARTTSAPIGYVQWTRAQRRTPWGWEYLERLQIFSRIAAERLRSTPRPSWPALLVVALAAAVVVWWVMRERMPAIDPHAVIATHLAAAEAAVADERYLEPLERSALHHYRTVLALDPANARARSGVAALAENFVEDARTAILDRRLADAVIALDGLRRVTPDHRKLSLLDAQLRRAIDEQAVLRAAAIQDQDVKTREKPATPARAAAAPAARAADRAPQPPAEPVRKPAPQLTAALAPVAPPPSSQAAPVGGVTAPTLVAETKQTAEPIAQAAPPAVDPAPVAADASGASAPPAARKIVRYVAPDYPREALMRGIEGWVDLDLTINAAGDVVASHVVGGKARQVFDRAAAGAVRRWKYEPRDGGEPFQALQVRVTFELEE